jgi:acetyl esterase/lipase
MSNLHLDPAFAPLVKQPRALLLDANAVRQAIAAARPAISPLSSNPDLEMEDYYLSRSGEDKTQLCVRIYRRKNAAETSPVLLYLHGGGFFCGDLYSDESQCAQYALNARCAVVVGSREPISRSSQ